MSKKCCICGIKIHGFGNNPYPVRKEGECCDSCNWTIVLQARIKNLQNKEGNNEK